MEDFYNESKFHRYGTNEVDALCVGHFTQVRKANKCLLGYVRVTASKKGSKMLSYICLGFTGAFVRPSFSS